MEYLMPPASQMRVETAQTTRAPISRILEAARFAVLTPHLAPARHVNYHESDAADAAKVAYGPISTGCASSKPGGTRITSCAGT